MIRRIIIILGMFALFSSAVQAQDTWTVQTLSVPEEKAVFATVESVDVIQARARIGGTIAKLHIDEGSEVLAGDVLAVIVDDLLSPQIGVVNSQASALQAQLDQAQADMKRAQGLFDRDVIAQAALDTARTQVQVFENQLAAALQEQAVLVQRSRDGDVLAPVNGRVTRVSVIAGSVILPGETIAIVASDEHILRLRLPERHARFIAEHDVVRVDAAAMTDGVSAQGFVQKVYPRIEDGRVIADVHVAGLGNYFVGERVRVYVSTAEQSVLAIPEEFIKTRYGVDSVRLRRGERVVDVVIQRGVEIHPEQGTLIEVLSGLTDGDELVRP